MSTPIRTRTRVRLQGDRNADTQPVNTNNPYGCRRSPLDNPPVDPEEVAATMPPPPAPDDES